MENKTPANTGSQLRDVAWPSDGPDALSMPDTASSPAPPVVVSGRNRPQASQPRISSSNEGGFGGFVKRYVFVLAVLFILGIGAVLSVAWLAGRQDGSDAGVNDTEVSLTGVPGQEELDFGSQSLTINGPLKVNDTFVLTPQSQPDQAVAGQLYFDQTTNVLNYYNGTSFVALQGSAGDTVTNTADSTIINNNTGSAGTVTSSAGTPGRLAKFTDSQNIEDSLLSESGSTVTVNGGLHVQTQLGVGTGTPARPLHILTNNTTTDAPSLLIEQDGAGDSSVEFKTANNKSFFVGMDTSASGTFNIASSTSAAATIDVGENDEACCTSTTANTNVIWAFQVTVGGTGGTLSSISAYTPSIEAAFPGAQVALYTDAGGFPDELITTSNQQDLTVGWNVFSMSGSVNANTTYWLAYSFEGNSVRNFRNGVPGHLALYNTPYGTWPDLGGVAPDIDSPNTAIPTYMTVVPVGAVDSFDGINVLSISDTGATVFQNSTNSGGAFRVLNAAAIPQFVIDSAGSRVYIGNPTGDTTGALLVLDAKTDSGDPVGVNGALYYNADAARMRCYEDDTWKNCLSEQFLARGRRITDATTTSIAGALRLDDITLKAGRTYRISTSPLHLSSTVANDHAEVLITHTTDGSTPGTGSATLPGARAQADIEDTGFGETTSMMVTYTPASDETLSLLLCLQRADGTGTITLGGTNDFQIELFVEEVGDDVSDTGVDI